MHVYMHACDSNYVLQFIVSINKNLLHGCTYFPNYGVRECMEVHCMNITMRPGGDLQLTSLDAYCMSVIFTHNCAGTN